MADRALVSLALKGGLSGSHFKPVEEPEPQEYKKAAFHIDPAASPEELARLVTRSRAVGHNVALVNAIAGRLETEERWRALAALKILHYVPKDVIDSVLGRIHEVALSAPEEALPHLKEFHKEFAGRGRNETQRYIRLRVAALLKKITPPSPENRL